VRFPRGRGARRQDPRWLLSGLAISLTLFLFAISRRSGAPPPPVELPLPPAQAVALGRPDPSTARLHVGEFLQVDVHPGPDDRYATVISQPTNARPVLELTSSPTAAPLIRAVEKGAVVVTVLLEPRCPEEGACQEFRRNLGAIRVTVVP